MTWLLIPAGGRPTIFLIISWTSLSLIICLREWKYLDTCIIHLPGKFHIYWRGKIWGGKTANNSSYSWHLMNPVYTNRTFPKPVHILIIFWKNCLHVFGYNDETLTLFGSGPTVLLKFVSGLGISKMILRDPPASRHCCQWIWDPGTQDHRSQLHVLAFGIDSRIVVNF